MAVHAEDAMQVIAGLAEGQVAVAHVLVPPDTVSVAGADQGGALQTGWAEQLSVEVCQGCSGIVGSAGIAGLSVFHKNIFIIKLPGAFAPGFSVEMVYS